MKNFKQLVPTLAALLALASSVQAAYLVNDSWLDGTSGDPAAPTYAENNGMVGSDIDADGNIESAWFQGGGGTLAPVGAGGPLRGTGYTTSASWYTYFSPATTPVTLARAGDQLKLKWAFTPRGVNLANTSQGFNLALALTPSGSRTTMDGSVPNAAFLGYAMFMNMGQTLGNSNPFQLRKWALAPGTPGALLGTSGNWTAVGNGATTGTHGYDSDTLYTFIMTLTRNEAGGLDLTSTMTGGTLNNSGTASFSATDATASQGFSFDTFDIRPSGTSTTATSFDTSLFQVEFISVPEPSAAALTGLALFGLALWRRVRR